MVVLNISVWPKIFKTIKRNIFSEKFEPEVFFLKKFLREDAVCVDVGASYGRYTYFLSKYTCPKGKIFAFEPGSESFAVLSAVKFFHSLSNVTLIKKGLSDSAQELNLVIPIKHNNQNHKGLSLAYISRESVPNSYAEKIKMTTVDDFCAQEKLSRVDFIKCDVEGAEALVMQGGTRSIETFLPNLLFEINHDFFKDKFPNSLPIISGILNKNSYDKYLFADNRPTLVQEMAVNGNYFFIPPSKQESFKKACQS